MGPQLVLGLGRCHNSFSIVSLWLPSTTTPAPTPPRFTMRWSAQKYRTAMYRAKTYCTHEICCTEMYCTALHYTYYTTQMKCIVEKRLSSDAIMAAYCQAGTLCLGWIFIHGNLFLWKHAFIIIPVKKRSTCLLQGTRIECQKLWHNNLKRSSFVSNHIFTHEPPRQNYIYCPQRNHMDDHRF